MLAGCGSEEPDPRAGLEYTVGVVQARAAAASRSAHYDSVDDLLPNVSHLALDGRPYRWSRTAVLGDIVEVAKGPGFRPIPEGAPRNGSDGRKVSFDDPAALWKRVHVTIEVEELLGGEPTDPKIVADLGVNADTEFEPVRAGLLSIDRAVFFLADGPPSHDGRPVFAADATSITFVDDAGALTMPFDERPSLTEGWDLASLRASARSGERSG